MTRWKAHRSQWEHWKYIVRFVFSSRECASLRLWFCASVSDWRLDGFSMDFLHATVFCFPTSDTDKTLKVGNIRPIIAQCAYYGARRLCKSIILIIILSQDKGFHHIVPLPQKVTPLPMLKRSKAGNIDHNWSESQNNRFIFYSCE
jgi:hypothetical protein